MHHAIHVLLGVLVVSACTGGSLAPRESEDQSEVSLVAFDVIDEVHTGLVSGVHDRRRSVITTDAEWQVFWNELHATVAPVPDVPRIDFATQMVVVASMGQRPTGGFAIAIDKVTESDGVLVVHVVETSPSAACIVTQVFTAPVTAVVVPRRDATVQFVDESRTESCR